MKKLTFTLLFTLMAIVSAQAAKVYLKIGEGQVTAESNLAVWVWEGKNNFCKNKEWPGDKLTEKETIGGADYFVYTVNTDGSYDILFNNNEKNDTKKTGDILGLTGDYTFVLNADWNFTKTECAPVETYTVKLAGNAYGTNWDAPVTFAYNAETKEYVYEETETAKLADYFKIDIPETKKWFKRDDLVDKNLSEASSDFVAMNDNSGNMKITDAADYDKITLTVKNDNGTWKLKIVGVKTYTVQIKGVNYDNWGVNAPAFTYNAETGEYVYEETEETAKLADMFKIYVKEGDRWISNAKFSGALNNDLGYQDLNEGDVMKITDAADYDKITLTVKNDNGTWKLKIVGEKTDKTSSVAGVDAAGVVIAAANGEIVVDGAQSVAVYTAAGALVSTDARTRVAAGLYIVRADNVVKKVIVK